MCLRRLETDRIRSETVSEKTPIPPPDWEALIEVIAKEIVEERSPARILQARAKLYDLLTHCIPATTILKVMQSWLSAKYGFADIGFTTRHLRSNLCLRSTTA